MPTKNPHQKTINALCRKLDKAEAKRDAASDECENLASAISALGGDPSFKPTVQSASVVAAE